jgi:hypothetical protein
MQGRGGTAKLRASQPFSQRIFQTRMIPVPIVFIPMHRLFILQTLLKRRMILPGRFLSEKGGMSVMLEPSMRNSFSFCRPTTFGISLISDLKDRRMLKMKTAY